MPVNRHLWKRRLTKTKAPPWPCPSCSSGTLDLLYETFFFGETAESRRRAAEQGFNQFELKLIFSALLECTSCRETVACCGQGEYVTEPFQTGPDGEEDFEVIEYFSPHYFSHPMRILHIPFQVPPAIDLSIRKSFRLVFCDPGAAANHIRQCAETILATAGIAHVTETGKFIPFEQRIQKFED